MASNGRRMEAVSCLSLFAIRCSPFAPPLKPMGSIAVIARNIRQGEGEWQTTV